jgi:hypothetical protein
VKKPLTDDLHLPSEAGFHFHINLITNDGKSVLDPPSRSRHFHHPLISTK